MEGDFNKDLSFNKGQDQSGINRKLSEVFNRERRGQLFNQEEIFDLENKELENPLPLYAKKYFVQTEFRTQEEMVEKMILMSSLQTHCDQETFEERLQFFFEEERVNIALPLYGTPVSCGFPSPADDYIENHLSLDKELIKNPASTFFVRAIGDSMEPLIQSGDLLIIDRSIEAAHNKLVLATLDGEFTAKRLLHEHGKILLRAENPFYPDIIIHEERDFSIWGVITYIVKTV